MMENLFSTTLKSAQEFSKTWPKIMEFFQAAEASGGEKFNLETEIPGTNKDIWWFDQRVLAISNLIASFQSSKTDADAPLPESFVIELESSTKSLEKDITNLNNHIQQVQDGRMASLSPSNWVVTLSENSAEINFASFLQNLLKPIENSLIKYYAVAAIVNSEGFDAFADAVKEFSELSEKARNDANEVKSANLESKRFSTEINGLREESESNKNSIVEIRNTCSEHASQIETHLTQTTTTVQQIDAIKNNAESLKAQVDAYSAEFEKFQSILDQRNSDFEKLNKDSIDLFDRLSKEDKNINEMISQADMMLVGATNVGLGTTFNKTLVDLDKKLKGAQREFYVAIVLLFLSAIPLIVYLALASLDFSTSETKEFLLAFKPGNINPTTTLAWAFLTVPTVWLTKFAAARHSQLFQLKEHYQFKYSLAMSVEGFKRQSPSHADDIAAATFYQLSFNPADKLKGKTSDSDHPNPIVDLLMNQFGMNDKGGAS